MSTRTITFANLATTDGIIVHYGIYRATLHYLVAGKPYIDFNANFKQVATVTKNRRLDTIPVPDNLTERYLDMARPFATTEAPVFAFFHDCNSCYGTDPECRCRPRNPNFPSLTAEPQTEAP
jgi:hypothetical protein